MASKLVLEGESFRLRPFAEHDQDALARLLQNPEIAKNLSRVPFPYTADDARAFLRYATETREDAVFAIEVEGALAGCISLDCIVHGHKAKIGYWLGEEYWGRGIATRAVLLICDWGMKTYGLVRIYTPVFPSNTASMRVLEKAGFEREGLFRKNYRKDGIIYDDVFYAKVI